MPENTIDEHVLNFALNPECLETEFYTYAVTRTPITSFGIGIKRPANKPIPAPCGQPTGGKQVAFSDKFVQDMVAEIGANERAHVALL